MFLTASEIRLFPLWKVKIDKKKIILHTHLSLACLYKLIDPASFFLFFFYKTTLNIFNF